VRAGGFARRASPECVRVVRAGRADRAALAESGPARLRSDSAPSNPDPRDRASSDWAATSLQIRCVPLAYGAARQQSDREANLRTRVASRVVLPARIRGKTTENPAFGPATGCSHPFRSIS